MGVEVGVRAVRGLVRSGTGDGEGEEEEGEEEEEGKTRIQTRIIHFEGREPQTLHAIVSAIRNDILTPSPTSSSPPPQTKPTTLLSLEIEKPDRPLLPTGALADILFFSKAWACGAGYGPNNDSSNDDSNANNGLDAAQAFLAAVAVPRMRAGAVAFCTWGEGGSVGVRVAGGGGHEEEGEGEDIDAHGNRWVRTAAWRPPPPPSSRPSSRPPSSPSSNHRPPNPIDSVGAGDTFIAGMLFCLSERRVWSLGRKLRFANEVAGRKVFREGFAGLGEAMAGWA